VFLCLQICSLLIRNVGGDTTKVFCPLEWKSDGFGSVPPRAISCSSAVQTEFVGRVFHGDKWIPARILTENGKALIPLDDGSAREFDVYDVLTAPAYCVLQWVAEYGGALPGHSVDVDQSTASPKKFFIGKIFLQIKIKTCNLMI